MIFNSAAVNTSEILHLGLGKPERDRRAANAFSESDSLIRIVRWRYFLKIPNPSCMKSDFGRKRFRANIAQIQ